MYLILELLETFKFWFRLTSSHESHYIFFLLRTLFFFEISPQAIITTLVSCLAALLCCGLLAWFRNYTDPCSSFCKGQFFTTWSCFPHLKQPDTWSWSLLLALLVLPFLKCRPVFLRSFLTFRATMAISSSSNFEPSLSNAFSAKY